MTERQRALLRAIRDHWESEGYAPSLEELRNACGITSKSSVAYNLGRLSLYGLVNYQPHKARTLRLTNKGRAEVEA